MGLSPRLHSRRQTYRLCLPLITELHAMMQRTIVALLLSAVAALAQSQQASISGEVTDSTGARLVGDRVTATNLATNMATADVTNDAGAYLVPNLEIGEYTVVVEHQGFRRYRETKIVLDTAES